MKFGVNTWVWTSPLTTDQLPRLVSKIRQIGFDWIEYPIESPGDFDYRLAGKLAKEHELGVSVSAAINIERDLIHPDSTIREQGMRYVRHVIEAAGVMGAQNVIGPLYSGVGRTWQATAAERARDLDLLVTQLAALAQIAAEHQVTLCIEPLNRFETSFINTATQCIEVIDRVNHPNCQMMLDTFHMNIEEKSLGAAIRLAGPRLKHFHACENDRGTPGSGNVTWQDVAQGLKDIGYGGPVVIESFTDKVVSIARAAAIWRPLAASQDELASEGLAFLKQLLAN